MTLLIPVATPLALKPTAPLHASMRRKPTRPSTLDTIGISCHQQHSKARCAPDECGAAWCMDQRTGRALLARDLPHLNRAAETRSTMQPGPTEHGVRAEPPASPNVAVLLDSLSYNAVARRLERHRLFVRHGQPCPDLEIQLLEDL